MAKRADQKADTRKRILSAASRRLRLKGVEGSTIADVLNDAGLTHGTFYAHFRSKEALLAEAFVIAAAQTSERWIKNISDIESQRRLERVVARNLGIAHLNNRQSGCPFVAVGAEIWRGSLELRQAYEEAMLAVAKKIAAALGDEDDIDLALAIHAISIGGLTMARSVVDERIAVRVMTACRRFVLEKLDSKSKL